jgi:uncharacterized protein YbjT (DUF2867 family)
MEQNPILVVGATGYVGGRLVPRLVAAGYHVRCLVRDPRKLAGRSWNNVEIVKGDVLDYSSLAASMRGCGVMYYLVHSMMAGEDAFASRDELGARNAARAAEETGLKRIVYLGGLGKRTENLSPHLRSRNDVGRLLAEGPVPVTEFRAAMVIGSGSASFDMMHALVNRLPVMTAPRWISTRSQPISILDVLRYLADCLDVPGSIGKVIDIGGPDVLSYKDLMLRVARILHLRRFILTIPVLTPRLSSLWINLVTPIPTAIARPLIEGLRTEMVCENDLAAQLFPFSPLSFDEAVEGALANIRTSSIETRWTDAGSTDPLFSETGQILADRQEVPARCTASTLFAEVCSLGGERGWPYADSLWKIRGFIDKISGGVGLRRGRRHPSELLPGDVLDFWRVESILPGQRLVLRAEMKVPGQAWLKFSVSASDDGTSTLHQEAKFYPKGVLGILYWYGIYPLHRVIFHGMARAIARDAERRVAGRN